MKKRNLLAGLVLLLLFPALLLQGCRKAPAPDGSSDADAVLSGSLDGEDAQNPDETASGGTASGATGSGSGGANGAQPGTAGGSGGSGGEPAPELPDEGDIGVPEE